MRTIALVTRESGYVRKVMLRNPQALFFMIGWPLLFLFIVAAVSGTDRVHLPGQPGTIKYSTHLVASVIVIAVVSAAFADLVAFLVRDREDGVLKRLRSAPDLLLTLRVFADLECALPPRLKPVVPP